MGTTAACLSKGGVEKKESKEDGGPIRRSWKDQDESSALDPANSLLIYIVLLRMAVQRAEELDQERNCSSGGENNYTNECICQRSSCSVFRRSLRRSVRSQRILDPDPREGKGRPTGVTPKSERQR